MFFERIRSFNPSMVDAAFRLHRDGLIPSNTFLVDLDAVSANARLFSEGATREGLRSYFMTKQVQNNPYVVQAALTSGIGGTVAVDMVAARCLRNNGLPVSHVGHLNQVPHRELQEVLEMRPEVVTLYSADSGARLSEAARAKGRRQDVLIRYTREGDRFFTGQEGGIEEPWPPATQELLRLPGIRLVGVTSFPCIHYPRSPSESAQPTPNAHTVQAAAGHLREMGVEPSQVNMPGNTSSSTLSLLRRLGATHVEPGHGLLGTTPVHVFSEAVPEPPAYVYVSEVSHVYGGKGYVTGGGFFVDIDLQGVPITALVGRDADSAWQNRLTLERHPMIIDYHGILTEGDRCRVGDTAVFAFRTQMQMCRSYLAAVSGIETGSPHLEGLFDHAARLLAAGTTYGDAQDVRKGMQALAERYGP